MKIRPDVAEWAYGTPTYPQTTYHLVEEGRAACRRGLTLTSEPRTAKQVDRNHYNRFCIRCRSRAEARDAAPVTEPTPAQDTPAPACPSTPSGDQSPAVETAKCRHDRRPIARRTDRTDAKWFHTDERGGRGCADRRSEAEPDVIDGQVIDQADAKLVAMVGHELRAEWVAAHERGDEHRADAVIAEQIRRHRGEPTGPAEATGQQSTDLTGARCHRTDPHPGHRIIGSWRGSCAGIPDASQGPRRWINHYDAAGRWCRWSLCSAPRGSAADRRCPADCPASATEPTPPTLCTASVDDSPAPCGGPAVAGEEWCREHLDADNAAADQ